MHDQANQLIWHEITFKQKSPIHIGQKNYGVLSETRVFIPGWAMWGALVNSYGKFSGGETDNFEEGKKIFEHISCFYPKIDGEPMFPEFENGRLYIGNISEKQFRLNFTDVFVSTAIDPEYISAKDASLHETEIILNKSKNTKKDLCWIGLVGIKSEDLSKFNKFVDCLEEIFIGGEISYGFGRMKIGSQQPVTEDKLENWALKNDGKLFIGAENPKPMKNYIKLSDDFDTINSKLEFIAQYDFTNGEPSVAWKGYCFVPGSEIFLNRNQDSRFQLKKGVFRKI